MYGTLLHVIGAGVFFIAHGSSGEARSLWINDMPVLDRKGTSYDTEAAIGDEYIVLLVRKSDACASGHGIYVWGLAGQKAGHKISTRTNVLRIESLRGNWLVLCQKHSRPKSAAYVYNLCKSRSPSFIKEKCHAYEVVYCNDTEPIIYGITVGNREITRQSWQVTPFCLIKKGAIIVGRWQLNSLDGAKLRQAVYTRALCYLGVALGRFWAGNMKNGAFVVFDTTSDANSFSVEDEHKGGECAMNDFGLVCAAGATLWVYHMNAIAAAGH
ncbi:hypothetical protein THASP1DRAFT_22400 [Thamnocephalis sphaerospora]|uniref:Uncharacterized protein n=1 Tax=Thamnocephalis sphaerospora TaxID=78915 RepID=A0A4P9XU94_9FUNG|nr:hypothetical protein THASP1DRAFT_22400 [Thamnocephalis sphaerospora]|eukprot:RKP09787.1 hypothetical protein THASP1DRAFT_22400 [Thamnocephalis sphaerospora]